MITVIEIAGDGGGQKLKKKKSCRVKWKFNIPSVFRPVRPSFWAYISVFLSLCFSHIYMHTHTNIAHTYIHPKLLPSLFLPNSHYFNEYSRSVPRVKPYHGVTRFVLLKKRLSSRGWRSEIAGKFFTSGRHESYNSTVQRFNEAHRPRRVGMNRYENEEQCAIAKPEILAGRRHFVAVILANVSFIREMMDASV